jgi:hypothetical protein
VYDIIILINNNIIIRRDMETEENKKTLELEADLRGTPEWDKLRSEIYVRDRGICWVCNRFVLLSQYELGHLIDWCMGGKAVYENLAVMHGYCNDVKPHHSTLEEAMRWRLTPRYIIETPPKAIVGTIVQTAQSERQYLQPALYQQIPNFLTIEDQIRIADTIIHFFKDNPQYLTDNNLRIKYTRSLSYKYNVTVDFIRKKLQEVGMLEKKNPIVQNDDMYFSISNNIKELVEKYNSLKCPNWDKPKAMGITAYQMRIMFYLSDNKVLVDSKDLKNIERRVSNLNIPITPIPIPLNNRVHRKPPSLPRLSPRLPNI